LQRGKHGRDAANTCGLSRASSAIVFEERNEEAPGHAILLVPVDGWVI
jgi:hypothetical protein